MAADDLAQSEIAVLGVAPAQAVGELGKYRLIAELARGGMGLVHLAVLRGPRGFNKLLVVKELRQDFANDKALVASFMDEARLAARLNHPNIVQTIEVGTDGGRHFMAMEYLEGQPLQRLAQGALKQGTPLPLELHLGIQLDVLTALDHAHSLTDFAGTPLGVVHRDVSPQNVLVTYEGQIKLLDFGIAKTHEAPEDTRSGVRKGKARYMSPEQAACRRADRRADLFSAGVILWEAVAGQRAWEGREEAAILQSLVEGTIPRVRDARPDVDPELAAIVDRAMSVDPDARYPTALAMRDDLERYLMARAMTPLRTSALAALVSGLFVEERERLRAVIDAQLRALDEEAAMCLSLPSVKLAMSMSISQSASGALADAPPSTLRSHPLASDADPPGYLAASALPSPPSAVGSSKGLLIAAAAALAALVVLAAFAVGRVSTRRATAPSATVGGDKPPNVATANLPHAARVIVRASPSSAQIFIDDEAVDNPYVAQRIGDGTAHLLRVEAPGYETKTSTLTFASDIAVEIVLGLARPSESGPRAAARAKTASLPPSSSPQPSPPRVTATDVASKPIQTENPYAP